MFSHIMLGANDIQESKAFYDAVLATVGCKSGVIDENGRCFYITDSGVFAITKPINGEQACNGNGSTVGFAAKSTEEVDAWHTAGTSNGGSACEEAPGVRGDLYLAYLRDPSGNKICALYRIG